MKARSSALLSFPLASAIAVLLASSNVHSASLTWDGAANGNWNTSDLNWTGATPWSNAAPDDAVFGATGVGTVTLTEAISAGTITINNAGYTIIGDTITLSGGATALTSGATSTINSNVTIATAAGTITSGVGILTLGGTVNAGSLALVFAGAGDTTLANGISSGTTLTKSGAGLVTLAGSNAFTSTTIDAGTIGGGSLTLSGGATALTSSATSVINSNVTIATAAGTITSSAGTLTLGGTLDAGSLDLTFDGAGNAIVNNAISNGTTLTKLGAGGLTLGAANTYTGQTTITAGTLNASAVDSLGTGAALLINGGTLALSTLNNTVGAVTLTSGNITGSGGILTGSSFALESGTGSAILAGSGAVTKTSAGTVTLSGANTFSGQLTVQNGTLSIGTINNVSANGPLGNSALGVILGNTGGQTGTLSYTGATAASTKSFIMATGGTGAFDITTAANTLTLSGSITGDGALSKTGGGTLALTGASNSYGGGTTLNGGTVAISNDTSFGSGNVSVTGASRINIGATSSPANAISVGAGLTLQLPQTAATSRTATFSGQLTGSSDITVVATGFNAANGTYAFTNTNNTFSGSVIMPSGTSSSSPTASGNDFFNFNSIGDGGTFTFRKRGHMNAIAYTGAAAITFNTRQIALVNEFGNGLYDGGGTNPINSFRNNATDSSHTVTFNTNITPGAIFSAGTFFFAGTNTGNNTFAGVISNPTSGGNLGVGKTDAGKWILTGASSYLGEAAVRRGTLSVNAIDVVANNQPLGKNTVVQLGQNADSGVLEFTGGTNSTTDKTIRIGAVAAQTGGGTINVTGAGTLTFSAATFNPTIASTTATRTLTLGGTNAGANTISGIIQDNVASTGKVALTKANAGTWVLSNTANTYTGITTISGGNLNVAALATGGSSSSIGAAAVANTNLVFNGGTLQYTGSAATSTNRIFSVGTNGATFDASGTSVGTLSFTGITAIGYNAQTTARTITLTGSNLGANTMSVIIGDNTGLTALTKSGAGRWVLNGASTYTGTTAVNAGTLQVSGGAAIANAGLVSIADVAGATFQVVGSETIAALTGGGATGGAVSINASQTLTLSAGGANIYAGTVSGSGALTLSAGNQTLSGVVSHSGGANVTGNGILTLSNSSNSYTGVTAIGSTNGRSVLVTANNALGAIGAGNETTIGANGQLGFSGGINYSSTEKISGSGTGNGAVQGVFAVGQRGFVQSVGTGNATFAGAIELSANGVSRIGAQDGSSLTLTGNITQATGVTTASILFRTNTASDFVTLSGTGNSFGGDSTVFTGLATAGQYSGLRIGVDNAHPTNLTVQNFVTSSGSSTALDLNGNDQTLNGLASGGTGTLNVINLDTVNASTLALNPTSNKDSGTNIVILGGSPGGTPLGVINVVKNGAFTQTFSGANSYTGSTSVSGGTLRINGTQTGASGALTVGGASATGTPTLEGTGTLGGNVIIAAAGGGAAGTLAPGSGAIGNLVLNSTSLTLGSGSTSSFEVDADTIINRDRVTGISTLAYAGKLKIIATGTLSAGDTWDLFDFSSQSGSFDNNGSFGTDGSSDADLPDLGSGLVWQFDYATGTLTVANSASYASWINSYFPGETNPAIIGATADPDNDSIANAVEMVIGGNPATSMDTALLPTIELVNADPDGDTTFADYLLFTYRRTDLSVTAGVTSGCETDTDLVAPWTAATGAPGVVILVNDNYTFTPPAPADTDRVRVYVPRGANTTLFGRLNVVVP